MFNLKYKLMEEAPEDGGEGGSGPSVEELQAQLEATAAEKTAMQNKLDELLTETKKAKQLRREAEEQARLAAEAKAQKEGDFEQLFKSRTEEAESYKTQLQQLQEGIATEKRDTAAMKLAAQMAEGADVENLAHFIKPRLKYTDEGVKVLDDKGQLTVSTLEQLKQEFESSGRYDSMIKGSKSTGGGAPGGKRSGATNKSLSRAEFDGMAPNARMSFIKEGGTIKD